VIADEEEEEEEEGGHSDEPARVKSPVRKGECVSSERRRGCVK
jgi:hypothetical protein